jgi:hypothetical protein
MGTDRTKAHRTQPALAAGQAITSNDQSPDDSGLCRFWPSENRVGNHPLWRGSLLPLGSEAALTHTKLLNTANPVAAGEACVRLRSSRNPGKQDPPDTKHPPRPRQRLNQTQSPPLPQNPHLRPTTPFAATKIDAYIRHVADRSQR